ncbi:MAG: GH92 family glycosyl hydrolase [Bacteroidales bacterium]|nr:GH92 family glycosyl hydrolase [Bacteroidales bacterium]
MLLTLLISLLPFVNPFVGTDAHGHTFPGAVYPFGMIQLSPDTRPLAGDWDGCSGYHYSDKIIYGFSHTHLSGTGCDDWCDILVTPGGKPSAFSHANEKASPGYYEVYLDDTQVHAKLAAGRRSAIHEYTFPKGASANLTIDLKHRDPLEDYSIKVDGNTCFGYRISNSWARGQRVYFYMEFDRPVKECVIEGEKAFLTFKGNKVLVRVGISSVSEKNAWKNLISNYPLTVKLVKKSTELAWEAYLGKLKSPYLDDEHNRRFYTALYHTAIHPTLYSDINGEYRGMDGKVHKADGWERYTVFSLWDTFRGLHPLLMEIEPDRTVDFIRSMLSIYDEAGKLPVWELSGWETNCMIGYNAAPVIADAILRGLKGFDYEKAFQAMLASARNGEFGLDSFRENGLVLADDEHESVSKTLEYAFDDWCVAQVALKLGHMDEYEAFMTSAQYWKNVLDPETKFMRARLNGRWFSPFDPREVNNNYTEANSWQYSFFVPQDIPGLIEALGGPEAFEARLDALFEAPQQTTGRTQADITGLIGQYAHGNEPSHHIAYLYDVVGRPDKREARVNQILETLYSSAPDGLCGNEDCGQMSAWYVLSSLGKYPVCPVTVPSSSSVIPASSSSVILSPDPKGRTEESIVPNPAFVMDNDIFTESLDVAIQGEGTIYYTVADGPAQKYQGPFTVYEPCQMTAWAERDGKRSFVTRCNVRQVQRDRAIKILSRYSRQYTAGGDEGLIDSTRGRLNWRTGGWQGYQDTDFEAILDLLEPRAVKVLGAGFCQDARSWIWMPTYVEFWTSEDGDNYTFAGRVDTPVAQEDLVIQVWDAEIPVDCTARYVKVHAANIGTIPSWHPGAGYPGFIFVDEVWAR